MSSILSTWCPKKCKNRYHSRYYHQHHRRQRKWDADQCFKTVYKVIDPIKLEKEKETLEFSKEAFTVSNWCWKWCLLESCSKNRMFQNPQFTNLDHCLAERVLLLRHWISRRHHRQLRSTVSDKHSKRKITTKNSLRLTGCCAFK